MANQMMNASFQPVTPVDRVLLELNRICRTATLEFSMAVGRLIVDRLYGGDIAAWRSRGTGDETFAQLSRRPELPMSPAALYRCVAMYDLCERHGGVARWKHVSSSHLRAVIGLPDDTQEQLLESAERERWTVLQIENEAGQRRPRSSPRGGRPRLPELAKAARALTRCLDDNQRARISPSSLAKMDEKQTREVFEAFSRVQRACGDILAMLEPTLTKANTVVEGDVQSASSQVDAVRR